MPAVGVYRHVSSRKEASSIIMPHTKDPPAFGQCCYEPAYWDKYPSTPARVSIYCREHVPRRRVVNRQHWRDLDEQEASEKRLICFACRRFLVTGEAAPTLPTVFAQALAGDPSLALWARENAWIVASGFQHWIKQGTVPPDLSVYTRVLLLLEQPDGWFSLPTHVTLEVEVRYGKALESTVVCHLDSLGCSGDLLALMRRLGCTRWSPLYDHHAPQGLGSREYRAMFFGLRYDPAASERVAQRLSEAFGSFTLEWLYAAEWLNEYRE